MWSFTRKSPSLLGLDIGAAAVKLVELSRTAQQYRVDACAVEPLPPNAVATRNISDAGVVGEAIRRAVAQAGTKTRNAAVAIAGSAAVVKTVTMDASLADADLETEIVLEADRHLPFPMAELAMDFESLNLSVVDPSQVDVLLAACRLEHVASLEAAVALGGLDAVVVDIDSYCLQRVIDLLLVDSSVGPASLVEIGSVSVALLVCDHGTVVFHREEPFDGGYPADSQGDAAGAGLETASASQSHEALLRVVARLLRLYASAEGRHRKPVIDIDGHSDTDLNQLWLSGRGASAGFAAFAAQRLGLAVELADPFANVAIAPSVDAGLLRRQAPQLAKASGLALRAFDESDTREPRWCA